VKRIGLIGGTSWVSTLDYYRLLNEGVQQRLGGHHSADLVIRSLNFQRLLEQLQNPAAIETILAEAARDLHRAGAELLGIASNTGHRFLRRVREEALLPLVHIGDVVADALKRDSVTRIGVLGTSMTLSDRVLLTKFSADYTIDLVIPDEAQRAQLDALIFGELTHYGLTDAGKQRLDELQRVCVTQQADALLLACTELTFAFARLSPQLPVYDSTQLHCEALITRALEA
jgi:aspartate racemase